MSKVVGVDVCFMVGPSRRSGGVSVPSRGGVVWSVGVSLGVVTILSLGSFRLYAACCF